MKWCESMVASSNLLDLKKVMGGDQTKQSQMFIISFHLPLLYATDIANVES